MSRYHQVELTRPKDSDSEVRMTIVFTTEARRHHIYAIIRNIQKVYLMYNEVCAVFGPVLTRRDFYNMIILPRRSRRIEPITHRDTFAVVRSVTEHEERSTPLHLRHKLMVHPPYIFRNGILWT